MLRTIFLLSILSCFVRAETAKSVAIEAMAAWHHSDAKTLFRLSDPELIARSRNARVVNFYLEDHPEERETVASGSNADAIRVLCEALALIRMTNPDFVHFDDYISEETVRGFIVVSFRSGWRSLSNPNQGTSMISKVVLRRNGDEWRFLWCTAACVHFDFEWTFEAVISEPNQALATVFKAQGKSEDF